MANSRTHSDYEMKGASIERGLMKPSNNSVTLSIVGVEDEGSEGGQRVAPQREATARGTGW